MIDVLFLSHVRFPSLNVVIGGIFSILVALWLRRRAYLHSLPRYRDIPNAILSHLPSKQELQHLGEVDVVIVGSGVGSLATASLLSKFGYKVVVFEQHPQTVGGSTHTFKTKNYRYDIGVHYVGNMRCFKAMRVFFDFLSDNTLEWSRMNENFDVCYNFKTHECLEFVGNSQRDQDMLLGHFPGLSKSSLRRYYQWCFLARTVTYVSLALKCLPPSMTRFVWKKLRYARLYRRYCLGTTYEVMQLCGLPEDVIGALTYSYGDYGTTPKASPFLMQAFMQSHYNGGAYFPKGGSISIAKTLVASILRNGGYVFCNAAVSCILTEKTKAGYHKAYGVICKGVEIRARSVVSGAGFMQTFSHEGGLVSPKATEDQLILMKDHSSALRPSPAFMYLFVGLDRSDEDLGLPGQNIWHCNGWDHDSALQELYQHQNVYEAMDKPPPLVFLSNESAKDPDFGCEYPGRATVTMIMWVRPEWFDLWNKTSKGQRGDDYESIKETLTASLLKILYFHFPKTRGHVVEATLGSPLTSDKYLGRSRGEIYGLDHNLERFSCVEMHLLLHPETNIAGLYQAGQDVLAVSVEGAAMSGLLCAGRISLTILLVVCFPAVVACMFGLLL